jgi:hypothetical protein
VCETGIRTAEVDRTSVSRLVAGMRHVKCHRIDNGPDMIDAPGTVLKLSQGNTKQSVGYADLSGKDSHLLARIASRIDEIANTSQWVGTWDTKTNQRLCADGKPLDTTPGGSDR